MTYKTLEEWLGEVENYAVRAERIPAGAYPWIAEAWKLGALAAQQDGVEEMVPKRLLNGRDDFIVSKGLWSEFMDSLPRGPEQRCAECDCEGGKCNWIADPAALEQNRST